MKSDVRIRYTKSVIREAFFTCLKKKGSIKDVTVTEVCELAEVNRSTFYKYFKDCYDLVEQIEDEEIREFRAVFTDVGNAFNRRFAEEIIDLLNRYDDLIGAYAERIIEGRLKEKVVAVSHELCIDAWKEHLPKGKDSEIEMLFSIASASFFQLVITERGKYTYEEILSCMHKVLDGIVKQYM